MKWDILLERKSENRLNTDITKKTLHYIARSAERNTALGFRSRIQKLGEPETISEETDEGLKEMYRYLVRLRLEKDARSEESGNKHFEHIFAVVEKCAKNKKWAIATKHRVGGSVSVNDGEAIPAEVKVSAPFSVPALTSEVLSTFFDGIYERDPHIRTIHSAVQTCVETEGKLMSHILLYGLPGACKTVLTKRFKAWYERDLPEGAPQRVLFTNNISTTKAGLENYILDMAEAKILPNILVMDEIEKRPMDDLLCLNTLMSEGFIGKLNARVNRREEAALTIIGICNDEDKVREFQNGHLWSRFTHKLPCVRPSFELSRKILGGLVAQLPGGRAAWVDAALDFGWNILGQRDIREIKGHLDGRDRLLDGTWQKDQLAMLDAAKAESEVLKQEEEARANAV